MTTIGDMMGEQINNFGDLKSEAAKQLAQKLGISHLEEILVLRQIFDNLQGVQPIRRLTEANTVPRCEAAKIIGAESFFYLERGARKNEFRMFPLNPLGRIYGTSFGLKLPTGETYNSYGNKLMGAALYFID